MKRWLIGKSDKNALDRVGEGIQGINRIGAWTVRSWLGEGMAMLLAVPCWA